MTIIRIGYQDWPGDRQACLSGHGVEENEKPVLRRQVRRSELEKVFGKLPPTRIGLEACAGCSCSAPPRG